MRDRTHMLLALEVSTPLMWGQGWRVLPLLAGALLGSVLPDVDHPRSPIGRCVPRLLAPEYKLGPGQYGRRWLWLWAAPHRGPWHSLAMAAFLPWLVLQLLSLWQPELAPPLALGLLVGYLSHLLADMLTASPMMLLWPFSDQLWHPLPLAVRERSWAGKLLEGLSVLVLGAGMLLLLRARLHGGLL